MTQPAPAPDHPPDPWAAALRSAFDNAPLGMAVATPDGVLRAVNGALQRLLGVDGEALIGRALFERVHPDDRDAAVAECSRLKEGGRLRAEHECRFLLPGGITRHVKVTSSRVDRATDDGQAVPAHVVMHLEDVTERRGHEEDLRRAALHDPLTGLPNRALLEQHLQSELDRRRAPGEGVVVLFVDLDRFKLVNDRHGHAAGDAVLVAVADRIRSCLRPGDVAARVGGDEFVVLCPGLGATAAPGLAARLREAVQSPVLHAGRALRVTASIGTAVSEGAGLATAMLHEADLAMYAHKRPQP